MAGWQISETEWRFLAGKIIDKGFIFQPAMFDYRRVQLLELQLQLQHCNYSNISHSCSFKHATVQVQLQLHLQLQLQTPLRYATLNFTTLHHHYSTTTSPPLHYNYNYNNYCSYSYNITTTATTALRCNYNSVPNILCTTLCTALHPALVVEVTTAAISKSTAATTFRSINGFVLPSMHHNNSPLL